MAQTPAVEKPGFDFLGLIATVTAIAFLAYLFWLYLDSESGIPWVG